jgi:tRNA(fMet)-specific endonuclease VapC
MTSLLLDTNAWTRYAAGDAGVREALRDVDIVFLSVFVLGELLEGFKGGSRERENRLLLRRFIGGGRTRVLEATEATAEHFASLRAHLRRAGTPLPVNDVWIAAHVLETGSLLVTFDEHFRAIPGLRLWMG